MRREVAARSQGRPERWRRLLIDRALSGAGEVPAGAHREVAANLRVSASAPAAVRFLGVVQLLAWLACMGGGAWILLAHLGRAVLIDARVPTLGPIPVPTVIIGVSLALTLLCAGASRVVSSWVASRRARAVRRDMRALCRDEVERLVVAPLRAEDNRQVTIASFVVRLRLDRRS